MYTWLPEVGVKGAGSPSNVYCPVSLCSGWWGSREGTGDFKTENRYFATKKCSIRVIKEDSQRRQKHCGKT